jgi:hypothetical protein
MDRYQEDLSLMNGWNVECAVLTWKKEVSMKNKGYRIGAGMLWVVLVWWGSAGAAQQATEEMFTRDGLEYHFMLNDTLKIDERSFSEQAGRLLDQLSPLFIVDPKPKRGSSLYVDTKDRKLKRENLILRIREGQITLKARGPSANSVQDIDQCDEKKYEIDFFDIPEYSISSDINFKKEELDIRLPGMTPEKLFAFVGKKCAAAAAALRNLAADPDVLFPGVNSQYDFKGKLKADHPLAKKLRKVDLSVWFFPPTGRISIELAYTGDAKDKAELDALQQETMRFLEGKGLLNPVQGSKTEYYFSTYMQ